MPKLAALASAAANICFASSSVRLVYVRGMSPHLKSEQAFSGSRPMANGRGSRTQVLASSVGLPVRSRKRQKSHPSQPFAAALASRLLAVCSTRPQEVSGPPALTSLWQRSDQPAQPFLAATATRSDGRWGWYRSGVLRQLVLKARIPLHRD